MLKNVAWAEFLLPNSRIKPDVKFRVVDTQADDGTFVTVEAHKLLLASVSPVMEAQFSDVFGSPNDVLVESTTPRAFTALIDMIYGVGELVTDDCEMLFELLELVTRYQINTTRISDAITGFKVTPQNFVTALKVAEDYGLLFEKEATTLKQSCIGFVYTAFASLDLARSLFTEAREGRVDSEVLVDMLNTCLSHCQNCKNQDCKDGQLIKVEDLRIGLRITVSADHTYGHMTEYGDINWLSGHNIVIQQHQHDLRLVDARFNCTGRQSHIALQADLPSISRILPWRF